MSVLPDNITSHTPSRLHDAQKRLYTVLSNRRTIITITIVPVLILLTFVLILPILWTVWASFHSVPIFSPEWTWVGIENYTDLISDQLYHDTIVRSVIFAGLSVSLQLVTGVAVAMLIAGNFKFNKVVRAIVLTPYLIPTAMLGFILLHMFDPNTGIVNALLLRYTPLEEPIRFFADRGITMYAVVVSSSWKYTIFVAIMVVARIQSIPDGFYEAAEIAGANSWEKFRDITLPNLKGVIFIVLFLRGVWMFNKFDIIWILTKGGPGYLTTTAPIYAYQTAFDFQKLGASAAISVTLFLTLVIVAILYFYYLNPSKEVNVE
jgi:multiple sugar transport system permease protein